MVTVLAFELPDLWPGPPSLDLCLCVCVCLWLGNQNYIKMPGWGPVDAGSNSSFSVSSSATPDESLPLSELLGSVSLSGNGKTWRQG